ncbi:1-aminocyclopropane-1-carboxylate synthase 2 [Smittium mucronatum]|uniref:1-aminocyclopropane-1-carboxylate synthase 2 n=1 Tax=Smittium mucronatum TaxID=133383 RepID=A0A1R0GS38_9FUNG|nr:1-aminocyclopropane-1-carboxylate synthase 2 [Smittium mucronatum]
MSRNFSLSRSTIENLSEKHSPLSVIGKVMSDIYHPVKNPNGILNLGIASNNLQEDILLKKDLGYGNARGSEELRSGISMLINRYFDPISAINPSQIVVTNGVTSAMDKLASIICNPGDAILLSEPYYASLVNDVNLVAKAVIHGVPIPPSEIQSPSQIKYYESKYQELRSLGVVVKAIILCNPHNPTGKVYSQSAIEAILEFANKHDIFVICDEIYALSVYRDPIAESLESSNECNNGNSEELYKFKSLLSLENLNKLIDPRLIVVVHGMSKDFCMHGFRIGWVISPFNDDIINALIKISPFSYISNFTDRLVSNILSDTEFVDTLSSTVRHNLLQNYIQTTSFLREKNISYIPSQAGYFLLVDIKPLLLVWKNNNLQPRESPITRIKDLTFDDEYRLWTASIERGRIFYSPGIIIKAHEPGWIRLIFSQPWDSLKLELERLFDFFENDSSV